MLASEAASLSTYLTLTLPIQYPLEIALPIQQYAPQTVKKSVHNAGDSGSIPGLGKPPEEGNGYPPEYSWLENPMDRGAWQATVQRVTKSKNNWATNAFTFTKQNKAGNGDLTNRIVFYKKIIMKGVNACFNVIYFLCTRESGSNVV